MARRTDSRLVRYCRRIFQFLFGPVRRPVEREDLQVSCVTSVTARGEVIRFQVARPRGALSRPSDS